MCPHPPSGVNALRRQHRLTHNAGRRRPSDLGKVGERCGPLQCRLELPNEYVEGTCIRPLVVTMNDREREDAPEPPTNATPAFRSASHAPVLSELHRRWSTTAVPRAPRARWTRWPATPNGRRGDPPGLSTPGAKRRPTKGPRWSSAQTWPQGVEREHAEPSTLLQASPTRTLRRAAARNINGLLGLQWALASGLGWPNPLT